MKAAPCSWRTITISIGDCRSASTISSVSSPGIAKMRSTPCTRGTAPSAPQPAPPSLLRLAEQQQYSVHLPESASGSARVLPPRLAAEEPEHPRARYGYANELLRAERWQEAVEELQVYLGLAEDEGNGYGRLATALRRLDRVDDAADAYLAGIKAAERHGRPRHGRRVPARIEERMTVRSAGGLVLQRSERALLNDLRRCGTGIWVPSAVGSPTARSLLRPRPRQRRTSCTAAKVPGREPLLHVGKAAAAPRLRPSRRPGPACNLNRRRPRRDSALVAMQFHLSEGAAGDEPGGGRSPSRRQPRPLASRQGPYADRSRLRSQRMTSTSRS